MQKSKYFILVFFTFSLMLISLIPITNYTIDRYRVFNALKGNFGQYYWRVDKKWEYNHNDRFIPMAYLLKNRHKYDSFIFGNSRLGTFNVNELGNKWYRFNYNGGKIFEHLHNANILVNNLQVKKIILTINLRDFRYSEKNKVLNFDKKYLYPENTNEWVDFYYKHSFKAFAKKDIDLYFSNKYFLKSIPSYHKRDNISSSKLFFTNKKRNDSIKKNIIKNQILDRSDIDHILQHIRDFKKLCKDHNTELTLILLPSHYKRLYNYNPEMLKYIKHELVKISNYYDFTLPHNYMLNNAFWRDTIHYTQIVNDEIIRLITSNRQLCPPFGRYITEKNIDEVMQDTLYLTKSENSFLQAYDTNIFINKYYIKDINKTQYSIKRLLNNNCINIINTNVSKRKK